MDMTGFLDRENYITSVVLWQSTVRPPERTNDGTIRGCILPAHVYDGLRMCLFRSPRILQPITNFRVGISVLRTPLILERCRQQKREVDLLSKFGCPTRRTTRSLINSVPKSSHAPLKQRNSAILSSNTRKPVFPFIPVNVCIRGISPRAVFRVNKHLTPFNFAASRAT
jgi:hypothetical protein